MAVAPELLEAAASEGSAGAEGAAGTSAGRAAQPRQEGAVAQGLSRASGQVRRLPSAAGAVYGQVSTPSRAAQTLTKVIWAVALGLIVLQVAAEATGQQWSFALPGTGRPTPKQPYVPLYGPQAAQASMPGVLGAPSAPAAAAAVQGPPVGGPLSPVLLP